MFTIALGNVLLTLLYAVPGFLLCKAKRAAAEHLSTLSAVLIYICSPCMILNSFLNMEYSPSQLGNMGLFFVATLVLQMAFMGIIWLIFRKKFAQSKYRVMTAGSVLGNVGFFGLPVIKALFPDNPVVMCYSAVYVLSMNVLVFTVGVFCLTGDRKFMSLKGVVLNPTTLSFIVALPLYICGFGDFLRAQDLSLFLDAIKILSDTTTPLCMIILGIRLASVDPVKLFTRPLVYLTCALKLIIYPLFCYLAVYFLPLDEVFKGSILVLSSVPCASVLLNMAEMYHGERELAANNVLCSTLVCFITIPVLALLL